MSGGFTPQVQEALTRLGSRLSYGEAQEEMMLMWGVASSKATVCNTTMRHGHRNQQIVAETVAKLKQESAKPTARPAQLIVSVDGAMVQLTTGEWRETKLATFGEFEGQIKGNSGKIRAKTDSISYFAKMTTAADFEQAALFEWHKRGGENAKRVVAVNDGALWIQSFVDYHCPNAVRVLDYAHAQSHLADIGKAAFGAESDAFSSWYGKMSKQLGTQPPERTLNQLRFMHRQYPDEPAHSEIDTAIRYLDKRREMIDYPHFRQIQVPIGSGICESGHKVVMQRRMKQAGMRWAEHNVNAMLSLRTALCNGRWSATWHAIMAHALEAKRRRRTSTTTTSFIDDATIPVTENDCLHLEQLAKSAKSGQQWTSHAWVFPHRPRLLHRN